MGKKAKQQKKKAAPQGNRKEDGKQEDGDRRQEDGAGNENKQAEVPITQKDHTCKDNWDQFFIIRGDGDCFEWYTDWPQVGKLLISEINSKSASILVPGCGNSKLSESLYDKGFQDIINVDFSKTVISNMLRKNVRLRPGMMWRNMDMTTMKFDKQFDVVIDKGAFDSLMEPILGPKTGFQYLTQVKRLLKIGGKFVCVTLVESHSLDILFSLFRFGWKMSIQAIESCSKDLKLQPFMVVAVKIADEDGRTHISNISFLNKSDIYPDEFPGKQIKELESALEREKKIRSEYLNKTDNLYSLKELHLWAKGDLSVLKPGRIVKTILEERGVSRSKYTSILLDATEDSGPFTYHYGVFIIAQQQARDFLFSSEQGRWLTVTKSKTARLLMITLDSSNSNYDLESIKRDLSPLVKQLAPEHDDRSNQIPFMASGDGLVEKETINEDTGKNVVEDVVLQENDDEMSDEQKYRRLSFHRTDNLVQLETLLSTESSESEVQKDTEQEASESPASPSGKLVVAHDHLASSYHNGIISGILLISAHLKKSTSAGGPVKAVVIGLGAGLLPMFMKNHLPSLTIEVVELDPAVLSIARNYFGFAEDDRLKVHITDGVEFVKEREACSETVDIVVVDVFSADLRGSSVVICPPGDFVEESFLLSVKELLSEQGIFIVNLVSSSPEVNEALKSRIKEVFGRSVYRLELEEDVNEVVFAVKTECPMEEEQVNEARDEVAKLLERREEEEEEIDQHWKLRVEELSKQINLMSL